MDRWYSTLQLCQPRTILSLCLSLAIASFVRLFFGEGSRAVDYSIIVPHINADASWTLESPKDEPDLQAEVRDGKIYPHCPADGRSLVTDPITPVSPQDIDHAIDLASTAQKAWACTTFPRRRQVLRTLLKYVLDHQEEIVQACCLDSGKTQVDACFGEILVTLEKLQWTIKHGERALAPSRRPTNLLMCYKKNVVHYEPLGVVAACVSWNYPFHNLISPVISALFSGNAILVKPSEQTCWSSNYFTQLIRGALRACGHNENLVQTIICLPETADHLTSHAGIRHITFIGSREVAHKVCASAAKALTPVTVELGGKDPAIILDDAKTVRNINEVCSILMRGVFQSAGQNCIGIERVIAMPQVHDRILAIVEPKVRALRLGSATLEQDYTPDMGSMISNHSFNRLEELIVSATKSGAKLHCGGVTYKHPTYPKGHYFQPTLLSDVTPEMEIAQTELFAPVFLLMRAVSVDEALRVANSTRYGLGASVFGHASPDVQKCVRELQAGMVAINDFGSYYACSLPFGGIKGSGYGRFGGEEGLRALCNVKAVCEDVWWAKMLGMRTKIPEILQYPIIDGSWQMCKGVVETGYALSLGQRARGVYKLVSAASIRRPSKHGRTGRK